MRVLHTLPVWLLGVGAAPGVAALDSTWTLSYQGHVAPDVAADQSVTQHGVSVRWEGTQDVGETSLHANVRASRDPERDRSVYDDTVYVDEFYARRTIGPVDIVAGRQWVRGGRATLVNPTDAFDARDYRDALLSADRVRAIDGLRATWYADAWTVSAASTPVHTPSLMPHPESRWFFALPATVDVGGGQRLPVVYDWTDYDARHVGHLQTQFKVSHEAEGASYSLSWFDGEDNLPAFDGRSPVPGDAGLFVGIDQLYAERQMLGADAEILVGKAVLRVEAARIDLTFADGRRDDYDHLVAGFDLQVENGLFGKETYVAFEYSKQFARDGQDWTKEDLRHIFANAFLARIDLTLGDHDRLVADIVYDHRNGQNAALLEYRHEYTDALSLSLTADLLGGSADTFFGQFSRNDRLGLRLEYLY